ncbi:MAG: hypothetical protein R3F39_15155 [Myxococcota bacterium]
MLRALLIPLVSLAVVACAEASVAPVDGHANESPTAVDRPTLSLAWSGTASAPTRVEVHYARPDAAEAPRMVEVRLKLSGGATLATAMAGPALTAAGKELVTQVEADGTVRLVGFATGNLARIGPGVIAEVDLTRGAGPVEVALVDGTPAFAPAAANNGLRLGPPLREEAP